MFCNKKDINKIKKAHAYICTELRGLFDLFYFFFN